MLNKSAESRSSKSRSSKIEDIIMKNVMELFKGDAVKFFGIDKNIVAVSRTELIHIEVQQKIDDWLLEADDDTFTHLEFQTTYKKDDLFRFMVSDAMLVFKEHKPVKTIVVYSADIEDTIASIDAGSVQYSVEAFYMAKLDGDKAYTEIKAKVESGMELTKQDLMSVVFLPLMNSKDDKVKRLEKAIELSNELTKEDEQFQIQAMIQLLAEKFVHDKDVLSRLKELMRVSLIIEQIVEEEVTKALDAAVSAAVGAAVNEAVSAAVYDRDSRFARNLLREGMTVDFIAKNTGLPTDTVRELKAEMESQRD